MLEDASLDGMKLYHTCDADPCAPIGIVDYTSRDVVMMLPCLWLNLFSLTRTLRWRETWIVWITDSYVGIVLVGVDERRCYGGNVYAILVCL